MSSVISETQGMVNALGQAADSIRDFRDDLLTTDPLIDIETQYSTARNQLDAAVQEMYSRDTETAQQAASRIPDLASTFLNLSKDVNASATGYNEDLARVLSVLNTSESIAEATKSREERQLATLEAQQSSLERQIEQLQEHTSIYEQTLAELENEGREIKSLTKLQEDYNQAQLDLSESTLAEQINYYQEELNRLDLIINGTQNLQAAFEGYQQALLGAIGYGMTEFLEELNALKLNSSDSGGSLTPSGPLTPSGSLLSIEPLAPSGTEKYSFSAGGTVTGPASGFTLPTTFHGVEHITPDSQMSAVKGELAEIRKVLVMMLNTDGDQKKYARKIWQILDGSQRGDMALTTEAA
jgi:hypothetical protein